MRKQTEGEKTHGLRHSLIGEAKAVGTRKAEEEFIHCFPSATRQAGVWPLPRKQGLSTCKGYSGRQMPQPQTSPPLSSFPQAFTPGHVTDGTEYVLG